jgi:RNA-directed DNA polymerase
MEALYLLGFDPIGETTADANSYGFRRGRCCADALDQCHKLLRNNHSASWILEGDIRACFDRISHDWLLAHTPLDRGLLRQWLQAGYLEKDAFFATTVGSPQGGIISPALANWTLDGLERLLHERFGGTRRQRQQHKVHLVRYADDFVITGTSQELLRDEIQPLVAHFLQERGLELSHEKTSITHVEDGFDFLGQNVRRYGTKLLLKPSRKNVRAFLTKIHEVIRHEGGHLPAGELILRLNAKIRGWALYHRHASSKRTFARVDDVILRKLWRWARRRHRRKSAAWVRAKYFVRPGDGRWTFQGTVTDKDGGKHPVSLLAARSVRIRRHVKVRGDANPYDASWELYFEERFTTQMANTLTGRGTRRYLWLEQKGKCLVCDQPLRREEEWHVHHLRWRVHGGGDTADKLVLLHANCHRQVHGAGLVVEKAASREGRS